MPRRIKEAIATIKNPLAIRGIRTSRNRRFESLSYPKKGIEKKKPYTKKCPHEKPNSVFSPNETTTDVVNAK
jgi:hypothetical protein